MQSPTGTEPCVHCLLADGGDAATIARLERELAAAGEPMAVVAERRRQARRRDSDRRVAPADLNGSCRRRVRNRDGRRIADRRAATQPWAAGPALARRLRVAHGSVQFVESLPGDEPEIAETLRLVVRFQSGDTGVFREIYERFFTKVYRFLRSALTDRYAAEDQSQEVFVRVFRALPRYEIRGVPFEAWLFRIARNQAIDECERRNLVVVEEPTRVGRRRQTLEGARDSDIAGASGGDHLRDDDLINLVQRLPLAQRQVIVLRYVVDLDWGTIALALDKSPGAVRQLEQRAFSSLRRRLEALGRGPRVERLPLVRRELTSPVASQRRAALAA